jgi:DNA-3-methyladenine glycosylase II
VLRSPVWLDGTPTVVEIRQVGRQPTADAAHGGAVLGGVDPP